MTTHIISSNPVPARVARRPQTSARSRYLVPPRVLVALLLVATMSVLMTSVRADQPVVAVSYTVQPGDTLWTISEEITPSGADVRETIAVVRDLNGLEASVIQPGQVLRLPEG